MNKYPFVTWLSAWIITIVGIYVMSRSEAGTTILYYTFWLAVVLVLVTHYEEVTNILKQGDITAGEA